MKITDSVIKWLCNLLSHTDKACFNLRILHDSSLEAPCQTSIPSIKISVNLRDADGTGSTSLDRMAYSISPFDVVSSLSLQAKKGAIGIF